MCSRCRAFCPYYLVRFMVKSLLSRKYKVYVKCYYPLEIAKSHNNFVAAYVLYLWNAGHDERKRFLLVAFTATLPVTVVGALIGILCKSQAVASTVVAPLVMISIFIPMFIPESVFEVAGRYLQLIFAFQIISGFMEIIEGGMMTSVGILFANFVVLFVVFWLVYRKRGLAA